MRIIGSGNIIRNKDFDISQKNKVVIIELFINYDYKLSTRACIIIFWYHFT